MVSSKVYITPAHATVRETSSFALLDKHVLQISIIITNMMNETTCNPHACRSIVVASVLEQAMKVRALAEN